LFRPLFDNKQEGTWQSGCWGSVSTNSKPSYEMAGTMPTQLVSGRF